MRSVPGSQHRRRVDRRAHEQPGVWRVPRIRRQPGAVRHGGGHRPARRAGRHHWLGDPFPQRRHAWRRCGDRARSWTRAAPAPRQCLDAVKDTYEAAAGRRQAGRARARAEELGPRQRVQRGRSRRRALPRPTARSRSAIAGPRWARASTPSLCRWPSRSSASTPTMSSSSSTPRASSAPGRPPAAGER